MDRQTKIKLAIDKAFQKEKPVNNLIMQAAKDYDISLDIVHSIYEKDSKSFYVNLETFVR